MSEKIEMDAGEVKALIEQVNNLTRRLNEVESKDEADAMPRARAATNRTVTIMFLDGKPVVELENMNPNGHEVLVYQMVNPKDNKTYIMCANIVTLDPKTKKKEVTKNVNFIEFIQQGERRELPIKRMRGERWLIEQGVTTKQELQGDKYHMKDLGIEVPLDVVGTDNFYIVDIDGEEVEIRDRFVNMAKSTPRPEKIVTNTITE